MMAFGENKETKEGWPALYDIYKAGKKGKDLSCNNKEICRSLSFAEDVEQPIGFL